MNNVTIYYPQSAQASTVGFATKEKKLLFLSFTLRNRVRNCQLDKEKLELMHSCSKCLNLKYLRLVFELEVLNSIQYAINI